MKVPVSDSVLKDTTKCNFNFQCQKSDWNPCGEFLGKVGEWVIHESVDDPEKTECSYRANLGKGHYCTCPTRLEMYRLAGI